MILNVKRGITHFGKKYGGQCIKIQKINIIDTPAMLTLAVRVEGILMMVDGVILLVDSFEEAVWPQTSFALKKAIGHRGKNQLLL